MQLRDYQVKGIHDLRASYTSGRKAPLFVLPTGGGKTIVFCHIAMEAAKRERNVIILVHRVELLRQTSDKLTMAGVDHGMIHPNYTPNIMAKVQVASVQTLIKRMHRLPYSPDLIIVDEAHHATAGSWKKIIGHYPDARILGVTATPCRTDGQGLGTHVGGMFDQMVIGPSVQDLIDAGHLVRPVVYAPPRVIDLSGIRSVRGDYDQKQVVARMDKKTITGDAVDHYRKLCDGQPAIVFCASVDHAKHVAEEFRGAGYISYAVDGTMEDEGRKRILGGLGNGSVQVVTSCDLVSEGTDIPAIACAILLRPTQSTGLYLQQVGRALRPVLGKDRAIILDHVGNCHMHGLPDQDREWSLDGLGKKNRKTANNAAIRIEMCKNCLATFAPAEKCPECGAIMERKMDEAPKVVAGELEQITPEQAWQIRKEKHWEVRQAGTNEAQLKEIAKARGYKHGWVTHMLRLAKEKEQSRAHAAMAVEQAAATQHPAQQTSLMNELI